MTVEYAPKGLYGVLTPQANTTVEPELAIMTPPGYAWINARITSDKPTIEARLLDYYATLPNQLRQFANAPIGCAVVATSGMSYLQGVASEDRTLATVSAEAGYPVFTSATCAVDAIAALGARRIGLVSPYPESLNVASRAYWAARGLTVAAEANAFRETADFHPIYSLDAAQALSALDTLASQDLDAILMLGTGMVTLEAILLRHRVGRAPVLSCMLATGWRVTAALDKAPLDRASVLRWIDRPHWAGRMREFIAARDESKHKP